ncbi:MAG: MBOAT family protein [Pseudomonadota bacterium]
MLFNSYVFIFVFLPVVLAGFYLASRTGNARMTNLWLLVCSAFFYGWWNPVYLLLLGLSISVNFTISGLMVRRAASGQATKSLLATGVVFNLALLGYFKYANFFVDNVNLLFGASFNLEHVVLPLAISFFTFQQIAFLVDTHRGLVGQQKLLNYSLFVSFFPQLIAGPIVHHKEMMPQFADHKRLLEWPTHVSLGLTYFGIGLFKKVVLADSVGSISTPLFEKAAQGSVIDFFTGWAAALGYTLQLYFDFSGYSDMAMGIALLFGIMLPINFNSPYKSLNIIEFWRRWHMTLSAFLRDYLYIPLGGNRKGPTRRSLNLSITMLLGGLWHGAGWTFVVWGGLHGLYLLINHSWRQFRQNVLGHDLSHSTRVGKVLAWSVTLLAVIIGWVFFRAADFSSAVNILKGMFGFHGATLPGVFANISPFVSDVLSALNIRAVAGGGQIFWNQWMSIVLVIPFVFMPNSHDIAARMKAGVGFLGFNPRTAWLVAAALLISFVSLNKESEFLYFQF